MQADGFAPSRKDVQILAFTLARKLGIRHRFCVAKERAGKDWSASFVRRHPEIVVRRAEGISLSRAWGMKKENTGKCFELLKKTLLENDLMKKPGNIFNVDETCLQLSNKPGYVLAKRGSKDVHLLKSVATISVMACRSAEGHFIQPVCIFKGVNKKPEFEEGFPPGSSVFMSEKSPCVTSEIIMAWIKDHVFPREPSGKILIVLDGHSSHVSDTTRFWISQIKTTRTFVFTESFDLLLTASRQKFFSSL
jgi:hypothetical protein